MQKSESIANIAAALSAMQAELGNATKGATNPHFKSKYADLSEVLEVAKEAMPAHGLSFAQFPTECAGGIVGLTTILMHKSGEWLQGTASTPIAKQDPQGVGSAITYLRRCALKSNPSNIPDAELRQSMFPAGCSRRLPKPPTASLRREARRANGSLSFNHHPHRALVPAHKPIPQCF